MILNLPYIFQNIYLNFYLNQTSCRYVTDNIRAFGHHLARSMCVMRYIIVKRYPCWARAEFSHDTLKKDAAAQLLNRLLYLKVDRCGE